MKLQLYFLILFLFFYRISYSSGILTEAGSRSASMAHTSVALNDVWSCFNNQAGLTGVNKTAFGFYGENRYLFKELINKAAFVALPTKSGNFGVSYNYFGYKHYNEQKVGLAYARMLGKKLSVGLQLDYFMINQAEDYGNKYLPTFEMGFQYLLTDKLVVATHVFNPLNNKIADYNNEKLSSKYRFGLLYNFNKNVIGAAEVEKNFYNNPHLRLAVEYKIIEQITVRTGIDSEHWQNSFGFGLKLKNLVFDIGVNYHNKLGYTPNTSLHYQF